MTTTPKSRRLTAKQLAQLDWARRSTLKSDDWAELYLQEFPPDERRDVNELRRLLQSGSLVMHETRDQDGQLLTWSMSQDYPSDSPDEPSFWLGCWTVTRRSAQSLGIGSIHFAKVIEALKAERPHYIGRVTEIESTEGLSADSQPARRASFYARLGLQELDVPYEFPLFQPAGSTEYVPQSKLGKPIKAQMLIAPFDNKPITASQVRSMIRRIYTRGYRVRPDDPYIESRLALIGDGRKNLLVPVRMPEGMNRPGSDSANNVPTNTEDKQCGCMLLPLWDGLLAWLTRILHSGR